MMSAATPLRPTRASEDLPRERLARCGASALRDDELLAIVLGTGARGTTVMDVATSILHRHPAEALVSLELDALQDIRGLGRAKAGILVAAFELARRGLRQGLGVLPCI